MNQTRQARVAFRMEFMDPSTTLAAASRDAHLALRRVARQQILIERLHAVRGERIRLATLARDLGVSERTVARDVQRLQLSGVPVDTQRGHGGGVRLLPTGAVAPIMFDVPEVAALMSSLVAARAEREPERHVSYAQAGRSLESLAGQ